MHQDCIFPTGSFEGKGIPERHLGWVLMATLINIFVNDMKTVECIKTALILHILF